MWHLGGYFTGQQVNVGQVSSQALIIIQVQLAAGHLLLMGAHRSSKIIKGIISSGFQGSRELKMIHPLGRLAGTRTNRCVQVKHIIKFSSLVLKIPQGCSPIKRTST